MFEDMRVKVRLMGILSDTSGVSEIDLDIPENSNIATLLSELTKSYPGLHEVLWDPVVESPEPNVLILIDGVEINNLKGLNTEIAEDSVVVLLAVTHGG
jgi:molybdopterin converting factor small subunit